MTWPADPVLLSTVRSALALLLGSAALHKARDLQRFRAALAAYRLVPDPLLATVARAVVLVEVTLAAALLLPASAAAGTVGASALLVLYAAAIAVNLLRGRRDIDCGCGGPEARQPISWWLVARNLAVGALALGTLVPVRARPLVWLDWLTLACAVAVFALSWEAAHRLLAERERMRPHLRVAAEGE